LHGRLCILLVISVVFASPCVLSCNVVCLRVSVYMIRHTAVTQIGVVVPAVRSAVLSAFRHGTSEMVRAEACRAVTFLDLHGSDVITALQQRYLLEHSDTVKR